MENDDYYFKKQNAILELISEFMADQNISEENKKTSAVNFSVRAISESSGSWFEVLETFEQMKQKFSPSEGPNKKDYN